MGFCVFRLTPKQMIAHVQKYAPGTTAAAAFAAWGDELVADLKRRNEDEPTYAEAMDAFEDGETPESAGEWITEQRELVRIAYRNVGLTLP